jgi:hypothetical protein
MVKYTRTTESGAKITFERTIDRPSTRVLEMYEKARKGVKKGKKVKKRKEKKFIKKPKAKLPSVDPKKFITKGLGHTPLVGEGRTGYFNQEMMGERKWLS